VQSPRSKGLVPRIDEAEHVVKSICPFCAVGCGQLVYVKDGEITHIEGDPASPISRGRLCPKGQASKSFVQSPIREYKVKYRRPYGTSWEELSLEDAMEMIVERITSTREETWQAETDDGKPAKRTLGIANLGGVLARPIAEKYGKLSALVARAEQLGSEALVAELCEIDGIGETIAQSVDRFLRDPHVAVVLGKLAERGVDPAQPVRAVTEGPLTGKTLVVTGTLTAPRADVQKRIEAAGGKVAGSVSKKTSYLVAGEDTGKAKLEAAQKHGVQVISEAELEQLLAGPAAAAAEARS
jgi:NAD-dependent DNA ligase